jgi:hypothetical protein
MTKARLTRSIPALAAVLVVLATGMSATDAGAKAPQPTSAGSAVRKAPAASHARRKDSAPVKSVPVKSAAAKPVLVAPHSPRPVLAKPPARKGAAPRELGRGEGSPAQGQGTVIVSGSCARLTVNGEKYPCQGAIYALRPDGQVWLQFATHRGTVLLVGGGQKDTDALEFGLRIDEVRTAASDRTVRHYAAQGRCTIAMRDAGGEDVRAITCSARGGAVQVEVDFRSDGHKIGAYYLLTSQAQQLTPVL